MRLCKCGETVNNCACGCYRPRFRVVRYPSRFNPVSWKRPGTWTPPRYVSLSAEYLYN